MGHSTPRLIGASALAFLAVAAVDGQTRGLRTVKPWTPPRTVWGQPDLQGVWNWAHGTPLERPAEMAGKAVLTDEELAEAEQRAQDSANLDRRDGTGTDVDVNREFNDFWHPRRPTNSESTHFIDCRSAGWETATLDGGSGAETPR